MLPPETAVMAKANGARYHTELTVGYRYCSELEISIA